MSGKRVLKHFFVIWARAHDLNSQSSESTITALMRLKIAVGRLDLNNVKTKEATDAHLAKTCTLRNCNVPNSTKQNKNFFITLPSRSYRQTRPRQPLPCRLKP